MWAVSRLGHEEKRAEMALGHLVAAHRSAVYTNTQIHKYTNTQIHNYTNTQIHKYTNTQIHKYTNRQIDKYKYK